MIIKLDSVAARVKRKAGLQAFTIIEIAIALGVIGFALVAIIGILPTGMQVQKDNRYDTVINQDASTIMEAIRNGDRGLDDLTNYVLAITNYVTEYSGANPTKPLRSYVFAYTPLGSWSGTAPMSPSYPITNGLRIIGLLSNPKFRVFGLNNGRTIAFASNYVVAYMRSLSGLAMEKFPQTNSSVRELAFTYRVAADIVPMSDVHPDWINPNDPKIAGNTNMMISRTNYAAYIRNMQNNLHEIRLLYRWPMLPNGNTGNGKQIFHTMISGELRSEVEANFPNAPEYTLWFFHNRNYVKAP